MEIARDSYVQALAEGMNNGLIKIITGLRRAGKSYLLFELFRRHLLREGVADAEHIVSLQFDRWEMRRYRQPDLFMEYLADVTKAPGNYYVLLDEVQLLEHFAEVLNSLLYRRELDIYVTGSNSRFLSRDVATEFRGRGYEIHIYPLTFGEFMTATEDTLPNAWSRYVMYGGLPPVVTMNRNEQKANYLGQLFRETYLIDIRERNRLERPQELEDTLDIVASAIGSLTNPSKIHATFRSRLHSGLSINTVIQYLSYLEDAFLISKAQRYDVKGRKYIDTPLKYYFEDVGLRNARLGFRQVEETRLMENIVYNELRQRGFAVDVGAVAKRTWDEALERRVRRTLEIDFVANLGSRRYYLQAAYSLAGEGKEAQEKASLLALDDSFKKIIIVKDSIAPFHDDDGILHLGLFDFLLRPDSLEW